MIRETPIPGDIPRYELTDWRERYGVVAGITGRPFDLGLWSDQPVGQVMTRWRQFRDGLGFSRYVLGHQCHGVDVVWTGSGQEAGGERADSGRTNSLTIVDRIDGHATASAGTLLLVTVADCIPIYLLEPRKKVLALLHSGWRGTAGGILGKGLDLLRQRAGVEPRDLVMHLGVGICGKCYEVGAEVIEGVGLRADGDGPWHVDLRERLAHQARAFGVREISISGWCSAHDRDRFFSHRASGGRDGRMVGYLGRAGE
ncbi:MAG TPA: polyphenol oxidase family protein [Gemmatimonadales bacterium]|nr:polyphenol oxidase family protein [Gemmatimonadales bacterium]